MANYVSVTWTTGDIITETKLDNMVANDRSENAHATGVYLDNNSPIQSKDSGATLRDILKITSGNVVNLGNNSLNQIKALSGIELAEGSSNVVNGAITASAGSNNLSASLKTLAGADASTSDPIFIPIDGAVRKVSAALSVAFTAGTTNKFDAGRAEFTGVSVPYFVYALWDTNGSAVRLVVARFGYAKTYADFSATDTNAKHGALSSGSPASTDKCVLIGKYDATLTFSTPNYNWSAVTNIRQTSTPNSGLMLYTPQTTGYSGTPSVRGYYILQGRECLLYADIGGTSNATTNKATGPWLNAYAAGSIFQFTYASDNGGDNVAMVDLAAGVRTLSGSLVKAAGATASITHSPTGWTNSSSKALYVTMIHAF